MPGCCVSRRAPLIGYGQRGDPGGYVGAKIADSRKPYLPTEPRLRQITRPRPGSSPPMKLAMTLAFEFSSAQADKPIRLLYVSLS